MHGGRAERFFDIELEHLPDGMAIVTKSRTTLLLAEAVSTNRVRAFCVE